MFRKSNYIDQDEYYDLHGATPFRQNLCLAVTPRKSYRYDAVWSGSQFNQSSMRQSRSMLKQSNRRNNDSSKITKVNNYVVAFDELLGGEQKEYSFCQQRALPSMPNMEIQAKLPLDDESQCAQLNNIHSQMVTLDQTINSLEGKIQEIKIKQLNFLNQHDQVKEEYEPNNKNELRLFNLTKDNQRIMELGKPEDFEKQQIVDLSQNVSGMVGRLSHLLQFQNQTKMSYKGNELDQGSETSFTFNKNLNRFTKVYKCKFCDLTFMKACSLGGHISRTHKEESMQFKKDLTPIKKTSIVKQRKAALLKSISQALILE